MCGTPEKCLCVAELFKTRRDFAVRRGRVVLAAESRRMVLRVYICVCVRVCHRDFYRRHYSVALLPLARGLRPSYAW